MLNVLMLTCSPNQLLARHFCSEQYEKIHTIYSHESMWNDSTHIARVVRSMEFETGPECSVMLACLISLWLVL